MTKQFSYVFLRYVHSLRLDETINIGMLFYFPEQGRIIARFPERLKRLQCLYSDFDEGILKDQFRLIREKISLIDGGGRVFQQKFSGVSLRQYIYNDILVNDQSALQISQEKKGVLYSSDIEKIAGDIFNSYFTYYQDFELRKDQPLATTESDSETTTDVILAERFENYLLLKDHDALNKIYKKVQYFSVSTDTSIVFDYKWENGTENLVKTLSFDLSSKKQIEQKALAFNGRIHVLDVDNAFSTKTKLHLIVARPQNIKLEKQFISALGILKNSIKDTRIVEENELSGYSDEVIKYLS